MAASCGSHLGGYNCVQYGADSLLFLDICDKQGQILEYSLSAKTTKPFAHQCPGGNQQSILTNIGGKPALLHLPSDWSQKLEAVSQLSGDKWERHEVDASVFPGRHSVFTVGAKGHLYVIHDWPNEGEWFLSVLAFGDGKWKQEKKVDLSFVKADCGFDKLDQKRPAVAAIAELHGGNDVMLVYSGQGLRSIDTAPLDTAAVLREVHKAGDPHVDKFGLKGDSMPNFSVFAGLGSHWHAGRFYVVTMGHSSSMWALDLPTSLGGKGGAEWIWTGAGGCQMRILMDTGLSRSSCFVESGGSAKVCVVYKCKPHTDVTVEPMELH